MPEGPELHLSSIFINRICKDLIFSGKVDRNPVHKSADIVWNEPEYKIEAQSKGKELMLNLFACNSNGSKAQLKSTSILITFGMSGKFEFQKATDLMKHSHLNFLTKNEPKMALSFVDYRRFGRWFQDSGWSSSRGPCVIQESNRFVQNVARNLNKPAFNKPICEVLLNQEYFSGIGNYLRAEILYRCKIPPFEQARKVLELKGNYPEMKQESQDLKIKEELLDIKVKGEHEEVKLKEEVKEEPSNQTNRDSKKPKTTKRKGNKAKNGEFRIAKFPCGVCQIGVGRNSIFCPHCKLWIHGKCSRLTVKLTKAVDFKCPSCCGNKQQDNLPHIPIEVTLDGNSLEVVDKMCSLGARESQDLKIKEELIDIKVKEELKEAGDQSNHDSRKPQTTKRKGKKAKIEDVSQCKYSKVEVNGSDFNIEHFEEKAQELLRLCHTVPLEVVELGSKKSSLSEMYYDDTDGSFNNWLQCYYQEGMKNMVDHNKRTVWFTGPAGPMTPKEEKQRKPNKKKKPAETCDTKEKTQPEEITDAKAVKPKGRGSRKLLSDSVECKKDKKTPKPKARKEGQSTKANSKLQKKKKRIFREIRFTERTKWK